MLRRRAILSYIKHVNPCLCDLCDLSIDGRRDAAYADGAVDIDIAPP